MRRSVLAALTALLLVSWPANAQTATAAERVAFDMTLMVLPQATTRFCPVLDAGQLSVTLSAVGDGERYPVTFELYSIRDADPGANLTGTLEAEDVSLSAPVQGGDYCLSLTNDAPTSGPSASIAELTSFRQDIAVKMTLTTP